MAGWIRRAASGRYQARYRTPGGKRTAASKTMTPNSASIFLSKLYVEACATFHTPLSRDLVKISLACTSRCARVLFPNVGHVPVLRASMGSRDAALHEG
jgi:hypothetical protein